MVAGSVGVSGGKSVDGVSVSMVGVAVWCCRDSVDGTDVLMAGRAELCSR